MSVLVAGRKCWTADKNSSRFPLTICVIRSKKALFLNSILKKVENPATHAVPQSHGGAWEIISTYFHMFLWSPHLLQQLSPGKAPWCGHDYVLGSTGVTQGAMEGWGDPSSKFWLYAYYIMWLRLSCLSSLSLLIPNLGLIKVSPHGYPKE